MRRAKQPSKQLNSEAIRGAALCYMSPVVSGQCSIISAKCVWSVKEKDLSKSWTAICKKRDSCDKAISGITNAAFFFSAISTQEKKKGSINEESDDSEDDQETSSIPITSSQQLVDGNPTLVNKSLWPSIAYWLALTTPNGAPANPLVVHRALLDCGVGVTANQVQFQDGKECLAIKELYKVLKDHRNPFMQELVLASYQRSYVDEFSHLPAMSPLSSQQLEDCGTENVVRVTLVNPSFQPSLASAVEKMVESKLQIDRFGFNTPETTLTSGIEEKRLSDKLTILINDITIAMKKLSYASYRGKVYKRDPRAKYTYSYKCDARAFINSLATNEQFKSRLVREMKKITELLSDPLCELFEPLVIDYDLIEVSDGVCWSLKKRAFVQCPIQDNQIGKISPRAFSVYDSTKEPDPKYFREILENSLTQSEVSTFCEDFLKLLNYSQKKHKDMVPCLVGEANSGKTSLFFPIQGLGHHGNIATVTKQRAFNKAMINPFTEIIFIDEADEHTLEISDWKLFTQGGYAAHDVKYQTARAFINKCPMLITAQQKLQFGTVHQPAMDKRLRTYYFRKLENPKKKAVAWLRKHPMECVVWAAEEAKRCTTDTESDEADSDEENAQDEEGSLQQKEKEDLRALSLTDPPVKETRPGEAEASDEESSAAGTEQSDDDDVTDSTTSDDALVELRATLSRLDPESLRYRERGVSTQTADLLPMEQDTVMPTPIQTELQDHCDQQRDQEERDRRENAREAFKGAWLRRTERELHDCAKKVHTSPDQDFRKSMQALLEVLQDKLKKHHANLGTLGTKEALEERKQACIQMGLLRERHAHFVLSVFEALPTAKELGESSTMSSQDEEQELYKTQVPSWETDHMAFQRTRLLQEPSQQGTRKRTRSLHQTGKGKKPCNNNTITNYFLSQQ
ncbi:hypothetical protein ACROYT_G034302 [Oculina patagonica]